MKQIFFLINDLALAQIKGAIRLPRQIYSAHILFCRHPVLNAFYWEGFCPSMMSIAPHVHGDHDGCHDAKDFFCDDQYGSNAQCAAGPGRLPNARAKGVNQHSVHNQKWGYNDRDGAPIANSSLIAWQAAL